MDGWLDGQTDGRKDGRTDGGSFPGGSLADGERSIVYFHAESCYRVGRSREKRSPCGGVACDWGATVFARQVGPNPRVHSDKMYNLVLNIRGDV